MAPRIFRRGRSCQRLPWKNLRRKVDDWSDGVTEQIRENMGDVHYGLEDKVDYDSDYEVSRER